MTLPDIVIPEGSTLCDASELVPYDKNPRTHSDEQIVQIANSIKEFGFTNPILIDSNKGIIAGHGRYEAAVSLKLKEVPVVVIDHLTPVQRRAYVIADNQVALNAGWDATVLSGELDDLRLEGFDVSLTGFTDPEMDYFSDGWADFDSGGSISSVQENLDGIQAKIVVECSPSGVEGIIQAIKAYCAENDIEASIT